MESEEHPDPLLHVIVTDISVDPTLHGLCVGYENGEWRCDAFASHLLEWLPEFALEYSERKRLGSHNAVQMLRQAAHTVYQTEKFQKRGEFGELILHAILRQYYGTLPAISKIYYKDGPNETVKGFDAVHAVPLEDELQLWLGEAKLYANAAPAIREVVAELHDHSQCDYLRDEMAAIRNKVDKSWPYASRLETLLHPNTSLDTVFDRCCFPVLITYDSDALKSYSSLCAEYKAEAEREFRKHHSAMTKMNLPPIELHLFLVPLNTKSDLVQALDNKLRGAQSI